MVYTKLKKLFAVTLAASMAVTSVPAFDYFTLIAEAKDAATQSSDADVSENDEGVYKVTMDASGNITADGDNEYAADENTAFSWDNVNMYFVITDRFVNGDKTNDHSYGRSGNSSSVPADYKSTFESIAGNYASDGEKNASSYESRVGTFHGGDLKGLTDYIENGYFDELGTNAIWITAPYEQVHGAVFGTGFKHYAYHGYYTLDYTEVDANMGTEEELHNFIDTAHEHGIRVVFDVVMNHSGYPDAYTIAEYYGANSSLLSSNWQQSYFGESEGSYTWEWDYASKNAEHGCLKYTDDWNTSWFTTGWQRMVEGRYGSGYTAQESGDEKLYCSAGLPDFKTEDTAGKGLPDILSKKWAKEGQLEKKIEETNNMLSACGYGSIGSASVKNYLVAWLSNWVREYGVDGFRCDTAKHVDISCWKDLHTECSKALKEWRENNPDKECAKWTDDFWMTGEVYDQGLSMNYQGTDYSQAFNSLINFSFQGVAGKKGSDLEQTYSNYAQYCNSNSNQNALSYVSSHDKGIGARGASVGTALLLCPGEVQTYYGDETSRSAGGGPGDQPSRSQMTWNDTACLANWQKVGRFRRNHIAVGAGQHTKIADSPYTFSRTYSGKVQGEDYEDKVVVALPGSAGTCEVSVGDVFEDGATVVDEYSGESYTVSGGKVSVACDSNGVILLGLPVEQTAKAKVTASVTEGIASGTTYSSDKVSVTIELENVKDATISVNGAPAQEVTGESAVVSFGEDTAYGEETTIEVKGTSTIDDSAVEKTFTYERSAEPSIGEAAEGLYVRVKKSDFDEAPQIYVYDSVKKEYAGAWPGTTMEEDGDYYVFSDATISGAVMAIIHTDAWRSTADMVDPEEISGSYELVKAADSGTFSSITLETGDKCTVNVKYVAATGEELKTITRVGKEGDDYTVYAPTTLSTMPNTKLSDGEETKQSGKFTKEDQTVTFKYDVDGVIITPTPTPTTTPIVTTEGGVTAEPIITATPTPTATPDMTAPAYDTPTPTATTAIGNTQPTQQPTQVPVVTETPVVTVAPTVAATATVAPTAAVDVLAVELTADNTSVKTGTEMQFSAKATGGVASYQYEFVVLDADGQKVDTREFGSDTWSWKPTKAGTYTVQVNVKDSAGTVVTKEISVTVTANAKLTVKKFTASRVKRLKYKLAAQAAGGTKKYKYKFTYVYKNKTKIIKNFSSTSALKKAFSKAGVYKITVYVKDSSGKTVKKTISVRVK